MDILSMGMSKDYPDAILEGRPSSGWALHCSARGRLCARRAEHIICFDMKEEPIHGTHG